MVGCDLQRILADAVFRHRCRSKGLCLRSPARRLARPLASATVGAFASAGLGKLRRSGGEQVLRLRARDGAFRAPARVTFFCCQKKVTKENHSNLRFKDPLARGGQVQIWRCWLRGIGAVGVAVGSGIACTACAAAADSSEGRGWCAGRFWRLSNRAFAAARRQR